MPIRETAEGQDRVAVSGEATGPSSVEVKGVGEAVGVRGEGKGWHGVEGFSEGTIAPIEAGDLLVTAPTPGHAMKATDPSRASGAVVGKALRPLAAGRGLIPVLVTLQ